ncbi:hypothetical protein ACIPRI_25145 [Variovorax sp. LARHSF232]
MHTRSRRQILGIALSSLALVPAGHLAWASAGSAPAGGKTMAQAAKKPSGSGIDVRHRLEGEPVAGRATRVVVVLSGVTDPDASVRFAADRELKLEGADGTPVRLEAGRPSTFNLTVVPQSDGLRYLNVFTTQYGVSSSTSIAVQAGAPPAAKSDKLQSTPKGDKIRSMPVK